MNREYSSHVVRLTHRKPGTPPLVMAPASRMRGDASASLDLSKPRSSHRQDLHNKQSSFEPSEHETAHLVRCGFAFSQGVLPKLASLFLIPMIFVYPLYPAYAADESVAPTATTTDATPLPAPLTNDSAALVGGNVTDATAVSTQTTDNSATLVAGGDVSSATLPISGGADERVFGDATSTVPAATSTENISGETPSPVGGSLGGSLWGDASSSSLTSSSPGSGATSTDVNPLAVASTTNATSSESIDHSNEASENKEATTTDVTDTTEVVRTKTAEELAQEIVAQKEESMRSSIRKEVETEFSKGCLTIDSIGYYCLKDPEGSSGSLAPSSVVTGVNSELDAGSGYRQIFMTKGGVTSPITHNMWDNSFPSMDVSGKSIVWQGNVSGRWQIFFADAATSSTPTPVQVTHSSESNFNPRVDGNDIVWQGWVDGNWEIFFAEHLSPENYLSPDTLPALNTRLGIDRTWKVTRITTNAVHDMFPSIVGGLVTWQAFQDNAWSVYAYSIKTGGTTKLSEGGAKSENPRFAITWDERTPEGAARMVGYDIASGKTIDLTNVARQVNDNSAPYHPSAPISQDNQAALPVVTTSGTSTSARDDGGDGTSGNGLVP